MVLLRYHILEILYPSFETVSEMEIPTTHIAFVLQAALQTGCTKGGWGGGGVGVGSQERVQYIRVAQTGPGQFLWPGLGLRSLGRSCSWREQRRPVGKPQAVLMSHIRTTEQCCGGTPRHRHTTGQFRNPFGFFCCCYVLCSRNPVDGAAAAESTTGSPGQNRFTSDSLSR